jgi:hypothetical protein
LVYREFWHGLGVLVGDAKTLTPDG